MLESICRSRRSGSDRVRVGAHHARAGVPRSFLELASSRQGGSCVIHVHHRAGGRFPSERCDEIWELLRPPRIDVPCLCGGVAILSTTALRGNSVDKFSFARCTGTKSSRTPEAVQRPNDVLSATPHGKRRRERAPDSHGACGARGHTGRTSALRPRASELSRQKGRGERERESSVNYSRAE